MWLCRRCSRHDDPTCSARSSRSRASVRAGHRRVVRWRKRQGERVAAAEILLEVETDKAVVEIEAPCAGVLAEVLAQEGAVVKMGERVATVAAG